MVAQHSSADVKIALFRSLFRGREDVYPRRFESRKTGKSGYSPACANEWIRGVCDRKSVKCTDCPNRRFLPVTDDVIRQHLLGQDSAGREFVLGMYPMLLDETCFLLAADFDRESWREDSAAVQETCRQSDIPSALERSRSGNGAHLWLFFEEAAPAALARKIGAYLLTETMERRPEIGLRSYDRFFPNQDTLPRGQLGNLIALPLQKQPRDHGNSVFLDDSMAPYADQWAFLAAVRKISRSEAERIVRSAEAARGNVVGVRLVPWDETADAPWTAPPSRSPTSAPVAGPLPQSMEIILGNEIYVAKEGLPPALRNRLIRLAAFQNPEFYRAQAMRLPTFDKPRVISCAEDHPHHIALPRGCLEDVRNLLTGLGVRHTLRDERYSGTPFAVTFQGELRPEQRAAAKALVTHDDGVLAATTAFGKTVIAAWMIAKRGVNTLVLVHRQQLMEQWVERLSAFLGVPAKTIGRIGGGRKKPGGALDVALVQSLVRKGKVNDLVGAYGHLVVDECHHLPATSFEQVARRTKAKYVLGLSATVARKDGHHPIIFMQCGPVRHRVEAKQQAAERPFSHSVWVRPTAFRAPDSAPADARIQFHDLYDALIADESRNRLIVDDVMEAIREGRSPVVLTERTEHLGALAERLAPSVPHCFVLQGGMGRKQLKSVLGAMAAVPAHEPRVLLATGSYIGEGFDDARLDTLFLTLPVSWRGTIAQYAGRLHRLYDGPPSPDGLRRAGKKEVRIYY
jgi:superfamily II DNA or RNA helicase